jgi:hypothetical protein
MVKNKRRGRNHSLIIIARKAGLDYVIAPYWMKNNN